MFAGIFGSNTPRYKGTAQPDVQPHGGVFGLISGLFAPSGPTYVRPQPESEMAPASPPSEPPAALPSTAPAPSPTGKTSPESGGVKDGPNGGPEPLSRHITIIVKPGPDTSVDEVVRFLQDRCLDD